MSERPDDDRVVAWRDWAKADAARRRLPELVPLIDGLSSTIARLRAGDWNADARRAAKAGDER